MDQSIFFLLGLVDEEAVGLGVDVLHRHLEPVEGARLRDLRSGAAVRSLFFSLLSLFFFLFSKAWLAPPEGCGRAPVAARALAPAPCWGIRPSEAGRCG